MRKEIVESLIKNIKNLNRDPKEATQSYEVTYLDQWGVEHTEIHYNFNNRE